MLSLRKSICCSALIAGALLHGAPAHASLLSSTELSYDNALLSNFNLVTLGNLNYTSGFQDTAGRVIVGGNVNMSSYAGGGTCQTNCPGNATVAVDSSGARYGALTVFGSVIGTNNTGFWTDKGSVAGTSGYVAGNVSNTTYWGNSNTTLRVGGTTSNVSTPNGGIVASVFPFSKGISPIASEVKALSSNIAGLANLPGTPGTSGVRVETGLKNGVFFTAQSDYTNKNLSYGVVRTSVAELASLTNFAGIGAGTGVNSVLVIVTGDGADYVLPNLNSYAGSTKIIYDFVDATTLNFGGNWSGSILAPLATINSMGGTLDGSVIVNSINQSQALYATNLFTGDLSGLVPEPASLSVLGAGVVALCAIRRRRRAATSSRTSRKR